MKPSKAIYDVGETRFGQKLQLEESREGWLLVQHALNQRDETQRIYVTPLMAAAILEAMR